MYHELKRTGLWVLEPVPCQVNRSVGMVNG